MLAVFVCEYLVVFSVSFGLETDARLWEVAAAYAYMF